VAALTARAKHARQGGRGYQKHSGGQRGPRGLRDCRVVRHTTPPRGGNLWAGAANRGLHSVRKFVHGKIFLLPFTMLLYKFEFSTLLDAVVLEDAFKFLAVCEGRRAYADEDHGNDAEEKAARTAHQHQWKTERMNWQTVGRTTPRSGHIL